MSNTQTQRPMTEIQTQQSPTDVEMSAQDESQKQSNSN